MTIRHTILSCVVLILLQQYGFCQTAKVSYNVEHFTDADGLPQNSITSCALSGDYLWIATQGGLSKFDGQRFTTFNSNESMGDASRRIMRIREGLNDTIYALTSNEKVIVIRNTVLKTVPYNASVHGPFWFYAPAREYNAPDKVPASKISVADSPYINVYDKSRRLSFICYPDKIAWYAMGILTTVTPMGPRFNRNSICHSSGFVYYLDPDGKIYNLRPNGKSVLLISDGGHIPDQPIRYFNNDEDQQYIVTKDSIYSVESGDGIKGKISAVCQFNFSTNISTLIKRNDGTIIIGTESKGLYILRPTDFTVTGADLGPGASSRSEFYAQTVLPSKQLLTGSGLRFKADGSIAPGNFRLSWEARSIYTDQEGYTWYAAPGERALYKQKIPGGKRVFIHSMNGMLTSLVKDSDGILWIGTSEYLARLDSNGFKVVCSSIKGINYVEQDSKDSLLLGTESGLYTVNKSDGRLNLVEGTNNKNVRFVKKKGNKIWISTYGQGIALIAGAKPFFFPLDRSKYLQFSHSIIEDSNGYFWIPTNKGLFQVAEKELLAYAASPSPSIPYYFYYNATDGFGTNEFNGGCQPAFVTLPDGRASMPSMNGLVWFDPLRIKPLLPTGNIQLTSCVINGNTDVSTAGPIVLPRRFQNLRFTFSSGYWGKPENECFQFRLAEPATSAWQDAAWNKEILLGQLEGGSYTLQVRNRRGFGENNFNYFEVRFEIKKAFTETAGFYILAITLLTGLLILLVFLRTHLLRNQKLKLQQQVLDKKIKLEESNYIKNKLISLFSHDVTTPLQFISILSTHLIEYHAEDPGLVKSELLKIRHTSDQLILMADDLLNWTRIYDAAFTLRLTKTDVRSLIDDKIVFFKYLSEPRHLYMNNNLSSKIICNTDRGLLGIIIHNIISNAVKFTIKGGITFSANLNNTSIQLIIEDTGVGMSPDKLTQVQFHNESKKTSDNSMLTGRGIGLILIHDFAKILNVGISYESTRGVGTKVILIIPLETGQII